MIGIILALIAYTLGFLLWPVFSEDPREDKATLQSDLDHATRQLAHTMAMEVEARHRTRTFDTQRWRIKYQEALHHYYMKKWKRMWDGCIDQVS